MCSGLGYRAPARWAARATLPVLLLLMPPGVAESQTAAAARQRAESLAAELVHQRQALEAGQSEMDTVTAGPLTVMVTRGHEPLVRPLLDQVAADWERLVGPEHDGPARSSVTSEYGKPEPGQLILLYGTTRPITRPGYSFGGGPSWQTLDEVLRSAVGRVLWNATPPSLRPWLATPPGLDDGDRAEAWLQVATVGRAGSSADRCRKGHTADCRRALGLVPGVDGIWSTAVRQDFWRYAVLSGSEGAWSRMAAAEGTVAEALAAAAGQPWDAVAVAWLADLERAGRLAQSGPWTATGDTWPPLTALGWVVLGLILIRGGRRWAL